MIVYENEPPENNLNEAERETWKAVFFLLDPRHHSDGQKIALEENAAVGQPFSILFSLLTHVNKNVLPSPFLISVAPIISGETFWEFVHAHPGEITSVTFDLLAPNMFGQEDELDEEMRQFRDREGAQTVSLQLINPEGLKLNTRRVQRTTKYVQRGGGEIRARGKGIFYNSNDSVSRVSVSESDIDESSRASLRSRLSRAISVIFHG